MRLLGKSLASVRDDDEECETPLFARQEVANYHLSLDHNNDDKEEDKVMMIMVRNMSHFHWHNQ